MALGNKNDLFANYQKSQENIGKTQSNPFANLDIKPLSTQRPQETIVKQEVTVEEKKEIQTQKEKVNHQKGKVARTVESANLQTKVVKTANGKTLKITKNGNTYSYEDIYDHTQDVQMSKDEVEGYALRLPKKYKAYLESVAKSERTSLNQLILRAIRMYVQEE